MKGRSYPCNLSEQYYEPWWLFWLRDLPYVVVSLLVVLPVVALGKRWTRWNEARGRRVVDEAWQLHLRWKRERGDG